MLQGFRNSAGNDEAPKIVMNGDKVSSIIFATLDPKWHLDDFVERVTSSSEVIKLQGLGGTVPQFRIGKDGAAVASFFRKYPKPETLVPISSR